ncbi:MAG: hypothetical protein ISS79_05295 [Phycisphaerae bacterium]|nr:hypothetical protein [Phycisphaerae bacterium]
MTDQNEAYDKKPKKKPSKFTVVCLTIMMGFSLLGWGVIYAYALVYSVLSPIGQAVGAVFMVMLVHAAVTVPRRLKRPPSRRQRVLVFCGALMAVGLFVAWAYWPDSDQWRPYTFDDELAAIEAKRAVPDEENAALSYEALFTQVEPDVNRPDAIGDRDDPFWNTPWVASEHAELSQWLDMQDKVIAQLMEACRFEECRFAVESQMFASIEPRVSKRNDRLKFCFKMLLACANRDIGEGRIESGSEKYLCALQMGKHCLQQPTVLDFYIGFEMNGSALRAIRRFVVEDESASKDNLDMLAKAIETESKWASDWAAIHAVAKLHAKNLYGTFYEVNERGRSRFTWGIGGALGNNDSSVSTQDGPGKFEKGMGRITLAFFAPWSPETAGTIIDDMYEPLTRAADPNFDWNTLNELERKHSLEKAYLNPTRLVLELAFMEVSDVSRFHRSYMRDVARCRGSRLIIGLRGYKNEHGAWPESLEQIGSVVPAEALVDPINGGAFVYRVTEDGFELYSKGANGVDEDGKRLRPLKEGGPDDVAIWPIRKRCNAKESAEKEKMVQEEADSNDAGAGA